jgi:intein-encoded DNA endonuclease-like protein
VQHFIRGFFDGEGSIGSYTRDEVSVSFASGSKDFLSQLSVIINKFCNVGIKNIIWGKAAGAYYLTYHTHQALKLCEWMYKDSTLHLDRKYNKYKTAAELL